jgi:hypothetical protein
MFIGGVCAGGNVCDVRACVEEVAEGGLLPCGRASGTRWILDTDLLVESAT